jgi:hypothetical protein
MSRRTRGERATLFLQADTAASGVLERASHRYKRRAPANNNADAIFLKTVYVDALLARSEEQLTWALEGSECV